MMIRKSAGIALAVLCLAGAAAGCPAVRHTAAQAEEPDETFQAAVLTTENASLFLPEGYEQYLALDNPADAAFSENHIAVADGKNIYVYDRAQGVYRTYTHDNSDYTVSKLQFSEDGMLYFSDSAAASILYRLAPDDETLAASQIVTSVGVGAFYLVGGTAYIASTADGQTSLSSIALDDPTQPYTIATGLPSDLKMTYSNDVLYCAASNTVYAYDTSDGFSPKEYRLNGETPVVGLTSICAHGSGFYYATAEGLYRSDLTNESDPLLSGNGFRALASYDGSLYCVEGASVHRLTLTDSAAFRSGYEIASASPSENRLSDACDTVRAGDLLVTADAGNRRVSVYNFSEQSYTVIPCEYDNAPFTPSLVATDGTTIAVASGANVYTCTYGKTDFSRYGDVQTAVRGLAVVYGTVYYVTENGMYGSSGTSVYHSGTPAGLTSDLYGNLFVALADGSVRRFTEATFLTANHAGEDTGVTLPSGFSSLRADFEGNLYCLSSGAVYRNGRSFASFSAADPFVCEQTGSAVSFALGYEDDRVYFTFGNYIVVSDAGTLDVPSLNELSVGGAYDTVFSTHEQPPLLCDVPAGSVGVATDLSALREENGEFFPYCGYARSRQSARGVLLAETDAYSLVLFADDSGNYTANLYVKSAFSPAIVQPDAEEYWTQTAGETHYLSNSVSAYFAPCLDASLADAVLERGAKVALLGVVRAPGRDYALVEYEGGGRDSARGYVPLSYLSELAVTPPEGEQYSLGYLRASDEGTVFRTQTGEERTVYERVQVRLYDNGDGTFTALLADDPSFGAIVPESAVDDENGEALRIALIVILTVLALVIIGVYLYLLPWEKYKKKKR